jgi:hypothetical protein
MSDRFHWVRLLAFVTGLVNQELLLRNEYLAAENRVLRAHLPNRLRLSDAERSTLAEIAKRLGRKALKDIARVAKPDTILDWYRRLVAQKFDGSRHRAYRRTVKKLVEYCNTAWNMDGVRHYPRWVRRVPGSTTSDQNRSCISTLSVPETTISSHRPELTHNIFSPDPSIRLSKLSANTTKHTSAAIW